MTYKLSIKQDIDVARNIQLAETCCNPVVDR